MGLELTKVNRGILLTNICKSNKIIIGASWDSANELELSLIPIFKYDPNLKLITYFANMKTIYAEYAETFVADSLKDRETINLNFERVPINIKYMYLSLYCYPDGNFNDVNDIYIRIYDDSGLLKTNVKFNLDRKIKDSSNLIPIRFVRLGADWLIEYIGRYDKIESGNFGFLVDLIQEIGKQ